MSCEIINMDCNHATSNDAEESSSSFRWPASSARSMADCIHNEVRQIVGTSRLVRKAEGVALVNRDQLDVGALLGKGAFSEVHEVCVKNDPRRQRYAMKHLKFTLMAQPENFRLAAAELAVEAHMLASFDHPNILKIRGWAANGVASFVEGAHDSFFLLLDCLDETLDQRIARWKHDEDYLKLAATAPSNSLFDVLRSSITGVPTPSQHLQHTEMSSDVIAFELNQIYLEKLKVCGEIASALSYLHECGVIFRDLKPNNIGILNGQVQLFDFGLSRELPGCDLSEPFEMSGKVGTLRYMAVEVASHQRYNVSADVYSWAMVCYEAFTCEKPFAGWTREMHSDLVCKRGMRPETDSLRNMLPSLNNGNNNDSLRLLLQACWDQNAFERPSMSSVYQQVRFMGEQQQQVMVCLQIKQHQHQLQHQQQQLQQHFLHQQQQQMFVQNPVTVELPIGFDAGTTKFSRQQSETFTAATLSLSNDSYGF